MRKFNARWWVDPEFLGRREDHNIDTFELLLGNYGLWEPDRPSTHCSPWNHPRPWDVSLRGPKTSIVFWPGVWKDLSSLLRIVEAAWKSLEE